MNIHKILFMANLFIIFIANFPVASHIKPHTMHSPLLPVLTIPLVQQQQQKSEPKRIVFRVHLIFLFAVKIICIYILIYFIVQSK